jgi:ribA/ribD-fused uncharacterized protein
MNTKKMIGFTKVNLPHGWMGNMSAYPIKYGNKIWKTSEALFQALRFDDEEIIELIRTEKSPMGAKMKAKKHRLQMTLEPRSEQDLENMRLVIDLKLAQHPELVRKLLITGDAYIYENIGKRNSKSGRFWGAIFNGDEMIGENWLGKILMEKREQLI